MYANNGQLVSIKTVEPDFSITDLKTSTCLQGKKTKVDSFCV